MYIRIVQFKQVMEALTYNPSTEEAEAGGLLQIQGQSELHCEFKASKGCRVKPCPTKRPHQI